MTVPGNTQRATNPAALERDRSVRRANNDGLKEKGGSGIGDQVAQELQASGVEGDDPIARRNDLQRGDPVHEGQGPIDDLLSSRREGENYPGLDKGDSQGFRSSDSSNIGNAQDDPNYLKNVARTANAAYAPTGDASEGNNLDRLLNTANSSQGTEAGTGAAGGGSGVGDQEAVRDAGIGLAPNRDVRHQ